MEKNILKLLAAPQESKNFEYKNNVQYAKKQYPLNKSDLKKVQK